MFGNESYGSCVIIVRNVPCEECEQCGEKYYSDDVMERLEIIVNKAKELASEVFVTDYNKKYNIFGSGKILFPAGKAHEISVSEVCNTILLGYNGAQMAP